MLFDVTVAVIFLMLTVVFGGNFKLVTAKRNIGCEIEVEK